MSEFNEQILVDMLAKLTNSEDSIKSLSQWCLSYKNKSKEIVKTWRQQFYCSPNQQSSFLYLAYDVLKRSRSRGDFVNEFWKVLPDMINHVIENGDAVAKGTAFRLVDIWLRNKTFGSRGHILKEVRQKHSTGVMLEKLALCYKHVDKCSLSEEALFEAIENLEKDELKDVDGTKVVELQGHIKKLQENESARLSLSSQLREALNKQDLKIVEVKKKLQVAQSLSVRIGNILQKQPQEVSPLVSEGIIGEYGPSHKRPKHSNSGGTEPSSHIPPLQPFPFHHPFFYHPPYMPQLPFYPPFYNPQAPLNQTQMSLFQQPPFAIPQLQPQPSLLQQQAAQLTQTQIPLFLPPSCTPPQPPDQSQPSLLQQQAAPLTGALPQLPDQSQPSLLQQNQAAPLTLALPQPPDQSQPSLLQQ